MKDITIKKRFNGFQVNVGCKELVFETKTKMMKEIGRYISNPNEVEAEYMEKYSGGTLGTISGGLSGSIITANLDVNNVLHVAEGANTLRL